MTRKIMFLPSPKDHGLSLPPTCNLLLWMSRCHISHLLYSYYSLKFKEVYFWEAVRTILCLLQSLFGAALCWKKNIDFGLLKWSCKHSFNYWTIFSYFRALCITWSQQFWLTNGVWKVLNLSFPFLHFVVWFLNLWDIWDVQERLLLSDLIFNVN